MKKIFFIHFYILFSSLTFAQLYLNSGGKIRIEGGTSANPVFVVLNSPPATPIVTNGTGNGIIMEAEFNRLQYNLGTASTAITVPYMSLTLESIPLTLAPTALGVGAGNIRFSAKVPPTRATGFDNFTYMPSDVTNMSALPNVTNNSAKTIDRFWIIDANAYTTKPTVNLTFTYIDAEHAVNGGNTITEVNLRAQRFNSSINDWGGYVEYLPTGTIDIGANTVSGVAVTPSNFFKSWTLNDNSIVLPIELINFDVNCINNQTTLKWCTSNETNNHYFTIEHSIDGNQFVDIGNLLGQGTTNSKHCYHFISPISNSGINYFRIKQTDYDGKISYSNIKTVSDCGKNNSQNAITNDGTKQVGLIINSETDGPIDFFVYNSLGQIIEVKQLTVTQGNNHLKLRLENVAEAMYYASVFKQGQLIISKKILITNLND
jgi:hypothetical protein